MLKNLKLLKQLFIRLLDSIHYQTDPAVSLEPNFVPRTNNEFWVPLMLLVLNLTYGTIGLQYEYESLIDINQLPSCQYMFTHQILPQEMWKSYDFIMIIDHISISCLFLTIIFNPNIKPRYMLYLIDGGTRFVVDNYKLSRKQSETIIKYRKYKLPMYLFVNFLYLLATVYFYITFFNINIPLKPILYLYWFIIFPLSLWFVVYGKYVFTIFMCIIIKLNICYIFFKQDCLAYSPI